MGSQLRLPVAQERRCPCVKSTFIFTISVGVPDDRGPIHPLDDDPLGFGTDRRIFYTYSISVMPGLEASEPGAAVRAMQGINAVIRTPVFAFSFFAALILPLLASVAARHRPARSLAAAGAVIYGPVRSW